MTPASSLSANYQLQTWGHAGSALRASMPAAGKYQDWSAHRRAGSMQFRLFWIFQSGFLPICLTRLPVKTGRGFGLGAFSKNSNWLARPVYVSSHRRAFGVLKILPIIPGARRLPRRTGSRRVRDHSAQRPDSRPIAGANALGHQHYVHAVADRLHVSSLSNDFTCCINKCQQARTNNCHSVTRGEK